MNRSKDQTLEKPKHTIIHSCMAHAHGKWPMSCANCVMLQHFKTLYFDETLPNVTDNALKEESLQI